jgi:hypothetical protein
VAALVMRFKFLVVCCLVGFCSTTQEKSIFIKRGKIGEMPEKTKPTQVCRHALQLVTDQSTIMPTFWISIG